MENSFSLAEGLQSTNPAPGALRWVGFLGFLGFQAVSEDLGWAGQVVLEDQAFPVVG
jgi:hypothetical protein